MSGRFNQSLLLLTCKLLRLILGAVLLIAKFYNDVYYSNNYIASINGLPYRLVNEVERVFAKMIDYHIFVSGEQYKRYLQSLHEHNGVEQFQIAQLIANATQPVLAIARQRLQSLAQGLSFPPVLQLPQPTASLFNGSLHSEMAEFNPGIEALGACHIPDVSDSQLEAQQAALFEFLRVQHSQFVAQSEDAQMTNNRQSVEDSPIFKPFRSPQLM